MDKGAWLATYSPWNCKELDTTEPLTHTYFIIATERMTLWGSVIDTCNLYYAPLNRVFQEKTTENGI